MTAWVRGIDVSHHNGPVDWRRVAASGVRYAWVKASEGTGYVDSSFAANVNGARAAGVLVGAYHFGHPKNHADEEAQHFRRVVAGRLDLPPVLDLEVDDGVGHAGVQSWGERFCSVARTAFGIDRLVLYTGSAFFNDVLGGHDWGCWLWLARYNISPPRGPWDIWQHTSDAAIPGIGGRVDENFTTEAVLAELAGGSTTPTNPHPQPQPQGVVDVPPLPICRDGVGGLYVPGDGVATGLHDLAELTPLYEAGILARSALDASGKTITHANVPGPLFDRLYPKVVS